jgi:hypothetical protein
MQRSIMTESQLHGDDNGRDAQRQPANPRQIVAQARIRSISVVEKARRGGGYQRSRRTGCLVDSNGSGVNAGNNMPAAEYNLFLPRRRAGLFDARPVRRKNGKKQSALQSKAVRGIDGGMYGGVVSSGKGSGDERRLLRLTECRELRPGR